MLATKVTRGLFSKLCPPTAKETDPEVQQVVPPLRRDGDGAAGRPDASDQSGGDGEGKGSGSGSGSDDEDGTGRMARGGRGGREQQQEEEGVGPEEREQLLNAAVDKENKVMRFVSLPGVKWGQERREGKGRDQVHCFPYFMPTHVWLCIQGVTSLYHYHKL